MKTLKIGDEQIKGGSVGVTSGRPGELTLTGKMESELIGYKKKVEQMTVLLKHYQAELESQKVRRDGVETVSRLLAESRQENISMKKKQATLEMMVKNLQNKLQMNGISLSLDASHDEIIVPGTSKQTLTNLALENKRLRSMLKKDNSSDTESMNSFSKPGEDSDAGLISQLQQTVEHLETENKSMRLKLSDLEALFKSSNNDKDRQLIQYHNEIQRLQETAGKRSETGMSIPGLPALKEQLKTLMTQCQEFEVQLDSVQLQERETKEMEPAADVLTASKQGEECADIVDGVDIVKLQEENEKMQERVKEVTKMNHRWQEFFNDREKYIRSLEQKVQEKDERLKESMHTGMALETNHQTNQKEVAQAEEMRRKAEEKVEQLEQELVMRDTQLAQLQSHLTALAQSSHTQSYAEACSVIEHLKAQVQVCTEDFEKERQDRQVALQNLASLKEENSQLRQLNKHLQSLVTNYTAQNTRYITQEQGHFEPYTLQPRGRPLYGQSGLAYDCPSTPDSNRHFLDFDYETPDREHSQTSGPVSLPGTTTELIARGSVKPKPAFSTSASAPESVKQENFLTCPKCNKEYSEEQQGELLAHMDVCWE